MVHAEALAEHIQHLGASRIEALLVTQMLLREQASTADIIHATGLRQPEVSVGMRELRDRGWIRTKSIPREGKGRPMHGYELVIARGEVAAHYKQQAQQQVQVYQQAMKELESIVA